MSYGVKPSVPPPLSGEDQARIRKAAWDANKNWWAAALFLFVLAIPSLMIPAGVVALLASIIVFLITLTRVENNYTAGIRAAEMSHQQGEEFHARWQTELASKHIESMIQTRNTIEGHLRSAAAALAKARSELTQRVYTLFWDNLERAAGALVDAASSRKSLLSIFGEYKKTLSSEQHAFPDSPASVTAIPDKVQLERELRELIRAGLRNEKCAAVWESWRGRHEYASLDRFLAQL